MDPTLWLVTYHLRSSAGTEAITNGSGRTALENVHRHLASHPTWQKDATVERIEVTLVPKASAAAAAQDLMSSTAKERYSFECLTAAALIQFVGVFRSLQAADPATAVAKFDRSYSDISVAIPLSGNPDVRMGGSALVFNMASLPDFSLRKLLESSTDMGLQRGDWVLLDNKKFITSGAFQRENATYLGKKRFFGHGMGIFTAKEYAQRLRRDHRVKLTEDQILDQVRVGPRYRAPDPAATASGSTPPTSSGSAQPKNPWGRPETQKQEKPQPEGWRDTQPLSGRSLCPGGCPCSSETRPKHHGVAPPPNTAHHQPTHGCRPSWSWVRETTRWSWRPTRSPSGWCPPRIGALHRTLHRSSNALAASIRAIRSMLRHPAWSRLCEPLVNRCPCRSGRTWSAGSGMTFPVFGFIPALQRRHRRGMSAPKPTPREMRSCSVPATTARATLQVND